MPFGSFVNQIPAPVFLLIHVAAFALGVFFARHAFARQEATLGWAFTLFAVAEVSYMSYHVDWTVFLFAHTISEVLSIAAFALVFVAATRKLVIASGPGR